MMNEESKPVPKFDSSTLSLTTLEQELRQQSNLLSTKLTTHEGITPNDSMIDNHLRQDIADIAAGMLVLTAAREGDTSPIPALLAKNEHNDVTHSALIAAVEAMAPNLIKR
jgi:hypothetical protein